MSVLKDVREIAEHYSYSRNEVVDALRNNDFECMTLENAEERAKDYIRETVWAFNSSFLVGYFPRGLDCEDIDRLRGDKCEDINSAFLALLDDFDTFAGDAISADGLGHFLSSYDGDCLELSSGLVAWRVN